MNSCTSSQSPGRQSKRHCSATTVVHQLPANHFSSLLIRTVVLREKKKSAFGFTMLGPPVSLCFYIIYYANRRIQGLPFGRCEKSHTILSKYEVTSECTLWCWEVGTLPTCSGLGSLGFPRSGPFPISQYLWPPLREENGLY